MVKVVTFFLIAMMILAIMGRIRLPRIGSRKRNDRSRVQDARKCDKCGGYVLRSGDCGCGKDN